MGSVYRRVRGYLADVRRPDWPRGIGIFAEWTTHGLWTDGEVDEDNRAALGISAELFAQFGAWNEEWERLADDDQLDDDAWNALREVIAWNQHGYELAAMLRSEVDEAMSIRYFDYVTETWVSITSQH